MYILSLSMWCGRMFAAVSFAILGIFCICCMAQQPEYPTYNEIPTGLSFTCNQRAAGYYADPEAQCQVWHWCLPSGQKFSFLCPNGTVFNQNVRVCDWWFNVDCPSAPNQYSINDDLYKDREGNFI